MPSRSTPTAQDYARSAAQLTAALGLAGVLTYAFFALASHSLRPEEYGRVVVLWSAMFIAIAVLFRPVEQLLSRTVAELQSTDQPTAPALRVALEIQLGVAIGFVILACVLRSPIQDRLFDGSGLFFWAFVTSTLGFGLSFLARGYLAGSARVGTFSLVVLVDATIRTTFAFILAVGLVSGVEWIAIGIAVAPAMSALVVLTPARRAPALEVADDARPDIAAPELAEFSRSRGSGFATAVVLVMIAEQTFLNSAILVVRAEEGIVAAGFIFNVLILARAPVLLFQAIATTLLPHLTRLSATADANSKAVFDASLRATMQAVLMFGAVSSVAVFAAGPPLMEVAFGDSFAYPRADLVLITIGMTMYLAATTLSQAVLAHGKAAIAAFCWVGSAAILLVWSIAPWIDVIRRVEIGFAGASLLLAVCLWAALTRPNSPTPTR